jgi:gliding motility-associated-like protein
MRKYFLLLLSIFGIVAQAQYANKIWYFGEQAGVNFNTTPPSALSNGMLQAYDNTSTVTDSLGGLLLYSNGVSVWTKNHTLMPNGSNLGGNLSGGQSVLIVPQPLSNKFYIFTVGYASGDAFRYSVVDMNLNGGNGDVTIKGQSLLTNSTEKIDAIYNPNDTSYWVITHAWNSSSFYAYKITKQGLQISTPVISSVGSVNSGGSPTGYNALGQMTISEDGSRLASAIYSDGKIELFDFNLATGQVSNPIILQGFTKSWGIAFSDNNRYLYFTEWYNDKVWQFDLISGNASTILASKTLVGTGTFPTGTSGYKIGYLERAFDGKIYIAKFGQHYISCINNPNAAGSACGFVDNAVHLGSRTCDAGLSRTVTRHPFFPHCSRIYEDTVYVCEGTIYNYQGSNYLPPALIHDTLVAYDNCDSVIKLHLLESKLPSIYLGNDTTFCTGDSVLIVAQSNSTVLWSTGDTGQFIYVSQTGNYWAQVSDSLCTNQDSISILDLSTSYINVNDTTLCLGETYNINLPLQNSYAWWNSQSGPYQSLTDSGVYWVEITDDCKSYVDTFHLKLKDCSCQLFIPNAFTPNHDPYNEYFYPVILCEALNYHLLIFNRWGDLIWESYDQDEKWDGTYKGNEVPEGVYFYLLVYDYNTGELQHMEKRGSVTLFR